MSATRKHLIIRGGLVLNAHAAHEKPVALDILIVDDKIAELAPAGEAFATPIDPSVPPETLDARDRLIVPGFVNAHYHSYDVLAKGLLEDMPFDVWALHSQPAYFGKRDKAEIRIRTLDIAPFLPADMPESAMAIVRGAPKDAKEEVAFVERQIKRLDPLPPRLTWGLSPSGPQRSSRALLEGIADLAKRLELPVFTHVYETKAQTAKARAIYGDHD